MEGRGDGRSSFRTIAMLMAIPVAAIAVFFIWNAFNGGETPKEAWRDFRGKPPRATPNATQPVQASASAPVETALPRITKKARSRHGEIVLIIDDLGFEGQALDRIMSLDPNINCSILPNGTRVTEFADALYARNFEILCHLPMEPVGGVSPGANAILTSMPDEQIARLTRENIEAVPHARGVNNHMGSRATADRRVMQTVLRSMPEGLYFIDSRTSGQSVAGAMAKEMKIRTASRNVFLDDTATENEVRRQLANLAEDAAKNGRAIGIGHPHPSTLNVLEAELPKLRAEGFKFVRASSVVR